MATMMQPTPGSEVSVYFDAPITHFHSKDNNNNTLMDQQQQQNPARATHLDAGNMNLETVPGRPAGDLSVAQGSSGLPQTRETKLDRSSPPQQQYQQTQPQQYQQPQSQQYQQPHPQPFQQTQPQQQPHDGMPLQHRESLGWLPATDVPPDHVDEEYQRHEEGRHNMYGLLNQKNGNRQNAQHTAGSASSLRSTGSLRRSGSMNRRAASVRSSGRQSLFTNREDGAPVDGSTFINGAGTTGPNAQPGIHDSVMERSNSVKQQLTPKQRSKVSKADAKESKALSKIIKNESKVEKQALSVAIKELGELQVVQKATVKREAKAHTAHHHTLTELQKAEDTYIAARRKYEVLQAQFKADTEALEISRQNARDATASMQEKSREIEGLRVMLNVDEGERQLKLDELKGKKPRGGMNGGHNGRQMNGSDHMPVGAQNHVNGAGQNGVQQNGVQQNGAKQVKRNSGFLRKMSAK